MSTTQNLFLGPYAAFTVRLENAEELPEDEDGEILRWCSFYSCGSESEGRVYYMPQGPQGELPKLAPRPMYFGGQPGWPWQPDLAAVDPRAEVDWFARAYAAELAAVGAALGSAPVFGWGLLARCT
jgi:hypothetical protein